MSKAILFKITQPKHHQALADILSKGGIVGAIWGHHLYFLACNACDVDAVKRMNRLKGRAEDQVFACPGAIEEAEEFADIKRSQGLIIAARKMKMKPLKYLEFLYRKFPLGVELYASEKAPSSVTFATDFGKTIWIAGHMADKNYSKLLETVRNLRRSGKNIVFAGTSLNLKGDDTLTVKEFDEVISHFGDKIEALSVHPKGKSLKKLRYSTSCSVVSLINKRPKLLRLGCTKISTLKKYIPDLQVFASPHSTRR